METDHDILVELRADVKALKETVEQMRDNTKESLLDHEVRLRFLERYAWLAIGAIGIAELIIGWYITFRQQ